MVNLISINIVMPRLSGTYRLKPLNSSKILPKKGSTQVKRKPMVTLKRIDYKQTV